MNLRNKYIRNGASVKYFRIYLIHISLCLHPYSLHKYLCLAKMTSLMCLQYTL